MTQALIVFLFLLMLSAIISLHSICLDLEEENEELMKRIRALEIKKDLEKYRL